jgi:hypothetical protein
MIISNFTNSKGNKIANQFLINTPDYKMFRSYNSNIVKTTFENGQRVVYLDSYYYNYSKTTSKYRNLYLGESTKEIEAKIKAGIYKLTNLNTCFYN